MSSASLTSLVPKFWLDIAYVTLKNSLLRDFLKSRNISFVGDRAELIGRLIEDDFFPTQILGPIPNVIGLEAEPQGHNAAHPPSQISQEITYELVPREYFNSICSVLTNSELRTCFYRRYLFPRESRADMVVDLVSHDDGISDIARNFFARPMTKAEYMDKDNFSDDDLRDICVNNGLKSCGDRADLAGRLNTRRDLRWSLLGLA